MMYLAGQEPIAFEPCFCPHEEAPGLPISSHCNNFPCVAPEGGHRESRERVGRNLPFTERRSKNLTALKSNIKPFLLYGTIELLFRSLHTESLVK